MFSASGEPYYLELLLAKSIANDFKSYFLGSVDSAKSLEGHVVQCTPESA